VPKLRFRGPEPASVYRPEGDIGAVVVKPGDVIDVPGEPLTEPITDEDGVVLLELPDDAYVFGGVDNARAYPHALWELDAKPAVETKPAKVKES
jgi:hypothetical protein